MHVSVGGWHYPKDPLVPMCQMTFFEPLSHQVIWKWRLFRGVPPLICLFSAGTQHENSKKHPFSGVSLKQNGRTHLDPAHGIQHLTWICVSQVQGTPGNFPGNGQLSLSLPLALFLFLLLEQHRPTRCFFCFVLVCCCFWTPKASWPFGRNSKARTRWASAEPCASTWTLSGSSAMLSSGRSWTRRSLIRRDRFRPWVSAPCVNLGSNKKHGGRTQTSPAKAKDKKSEDSVKQ